MSLPRFFSPHPLVAGGQVELAASAAHHAAKVLRMRVGDGVILFDGRGGEYSAALVAIDKKHVVARVDSHQAIERGGACVVTRHDHAHDAAHPPPGRTARRSP